MKIPTNIKELMQKLIDEGFEAYIVGGAVRDYLLGIEPHDYDLFSNATGEDILKIFPNGNILGGEERQKKILTVIVDGVEISQFRKSGDRTETGTTLVDHQWTCDFYINALAIDINSQFCGDATIQSCGIRDINRRALRFVGSAEERIEEDKLRILRGLRFMLKYKLSPDSDTYRYLTNTSLADLPVERIREEFIKLLEYKESIKLLHDYGILKQIVLELYHPNHFESGGEHHDETPFEHMIGAFKHSCVITTDYRIKIATLLHDIGKGETREEKTDGGYSFHDHDNIGAEIAERILTRLKFSKDDITFITTLIKRHMFGYMDDIQDKTYVKFYAELESKGISIYDYLMVVYCDRQANLKKIRDKFGDFCKMSNEKFLLYHYNRIKSKNYPFSIKDLQISGKDLLELGMKPGPKIGETLREIYDLVMEGELKNARPELLYYIKTGE